MIPPHQRPAYLLLLATSVLAVLYFLFPPTTHGFYPGCPSRTYWGFYCAGCGAQRALYLLGAGEWLSALRHNLLLPFFMLLAAQYALARWQGRPAWTDKKGFPAFLLALLLLYMLLRNIPVHPFSYLSPP